MIDKINIKVSKNRGLYPEKTSLGTVGENDVTELVFALPDELRDFDRELAINTSVGSFNPSFEDSFILPREILTDESFIVQLILKDNDDVMWRSKGLKFTLNPSLDSSGENFITQAQERYRSELAGELNEVASNVTGTDYTSRAWDELMEDISDIPVKSSADVKNLDDFNLLKLAIEEYEGDPNIGGYYSQIHPIFTTPPVDKNNQPMNYTLPYINTYRAKWRATTGTGGFNLSPFSKYLKRAGLDCSSAVQLGRINYHNIMISLFTDFWGVTLTGLSQKPLGSAFSNCSVLDTVMLYGVSERDFELNSNESDFYATFVNCSYLKTIGGDPLNFSKTKKIDNYNHYYGKCNPFYDCRVLEEVRFVPRTIRCDLNFQNSNLLSNETLVSITNGFAWDIPIDETITASFPINIKNKMMQLYVVGIDGDPEFEDVDVRIMNPETDSDKKWYTITELLGMKGVSVV